MLNFWKYNLYLKFSILYCFLVLSCNDVEEKNVIYSKKIALVDSISNHYNQGYLQGSIGEYATAINHYNKVIRLDSNYKSVWFNRAICFENIGDKISAFWDMNRAIENDSSKSEYWAYRGELNIKLSDFKKGKQDLTKAIELDSSKRKYHYLRGFYSIQFGDTIKGKNDLWKALSIPDTNVVKIDSTKVKSLIKELRIKKYTLKCY